jgi:hypothetical protein
MKDEKDETDEITPHWHIGKPDAVSEAKKQACS